MKTHLRIVLVLLTLGSCTTMLSPTETAVTTNAPQPTATNGDDVIATVRTIAETAIAIPPSVTPMPLPTRTPRPTLAIPTPRCTYPTIGAELDPQGFVPFGQVIESQAFQAYEVRVYEDTDCWTDTFEVLQNGERVYAQESGRRFWIGWYFDENGEQVIPIGQDITGNGIPNLVMVEWIGGAHCCTFFYIFELGPVFRRLGTVTVGDYEPRGVADLDGDGNWEFVVRDWAYAYYQGGGPWGPHFGPTAWVVLHYVDDGYHLVDHLMRKSAPPADDWETLAHTIRERPLETRENSWELGSFVLELIYSGHAELVEPFLDIVWSDDPAKRASYLQYLLGALSESLYWPEIKDLSAEWPWPED